jgi:hypothetical protein
MGVTISRNGRVTISANRYRSYSSPWRHKTHPLASANTQEKLQATGIAHEISFTQINPELMGLTGLPRLGAAIFGAVR